MGLRCLVLTGVLLAGFGGGAPAPLLAQDAANTLSTILTIDQDRLFTDSLYGERVAAEMATDLAKLEVEFQRLEADLTAEEKELTEKRATIPPAEFRKLADAFDTKVQEIRRAQDAKARELNGRMDRERAVYYNLVLPLLGELMKEHGAAIVLDHRVVFAVAEGVDITDDALRRIDATLGDGKQQEVAPEE